MIRNNCWVAGVRLAIQQFIIPKMKKLLIIAGVILIAVALFYFFRLAYYLLCSFEFTNYGYGILTGKILLLIVGIVFLFSGIKMKKKPQSP